MEKKMSKSIKVNFINGNRKSVCNNDAYSVVETINGKEQAVLDIIPVVEIPGKNSTDLYIAFSEAQSEIGTDNKQEVVKYARTLLNQSPAIA
jgi:hypothetical protein